MSDDKKTFTVNDRRHFTPEGRARETEPAFEPPPRAPSGDPGTGSAPSAAPPGGDPRDLDAAGDPEGADLPPFPADFLGLIGSLATQATVLLAGDPETRQPPAPPELEAVRSIIGLLDVLHEKTANNRNPQEDRVLDAVRYELKMAYVARTRAGGA